MLKVEDSSVNEKIFSSPDNEDKIIDQFNRQRQDTPVVQPIKTRLQISPTNKGKTCY